MNVPHKGRRATGMVATGTFAACLGALAFVGVPVQPAHAQSKPFDMAQNAAPATPAAAPSPERLKLANELLVANGEASSFDSIIPTVVEQAAGSFVQANPDLIRELRDVSKQITPEYEARKSEITAILARTYAAQFSEAELNELLSFYRSPTGRKLVQQRQELLDDGLKGIQAWSAKLAQEVETRVRAEMKKRGFTI